MKKVKLDKLKNLFKLWAYRAVESLFVIIGRLVMIAFFFVMTGVLTSIFYIPIRLKITGSKTNDIVGKKTISDYTINNKMITIYSITGRSTGYTYYTSKKEYNKHEIGDTIIVFTSHTIKKGEILGNNSPTLLYLLLNYKYDTSFYGLILGIVALTYLAFKLFYSFKELIIKIKIDINEEIKTSTKPISRPLLYIKSFTVILTGAALAYAFSFLIIKGVYEVEDSNEIISGAVVSFGILLILFTPVLFYWLRRYLKNISSKSISYTIQFISVGLSIYTVIKMIKFIRTADFEKLTTLELIADFLGSLLP